VLVFNLHQDVDPLADSIPPRHSIESDEDEDEYNPLSTAKPGAVQLDLKITHNFQQGKKMIIASNEASSVWSRGASLGEQTGMITLNAVQVFFHSRIIDFNIAQKAVDWPVF